MEVVVALIAVAEEDAVVSAVDAVEVVRSSFACRRSLTKFFILIGGGYNSGPPERINVVAEVSHVCEGQIVGMVKDKYVPLLARMIWTENKQLIGKVDDVFGPKDAPGIAVNPDTQTGVKAESFKKGDKVS